MGRRVILEKTVMVNKIVFKVYSLRYLAMALHRAPNTIRFWQWKKLFPEPILRTKDGMQWYTSDEIELYQRLLDEEQIKNGSNFSKTKFVVRAFAEQRALKKKIEAQLGD